MKEYLECWRKYAVFSGTATRREFWMFLLGHLLVSGAIVFWTFLVVIVGLALKIQDSTGVLILAIGAIAFALYHIAAFFPFLGVCVRRFRGLLSAFGFEIRSDRRMPDASSSPPSRRRSLKATMIEWGILVIMIAAAILSACAYFGYPLCVSRSFRPHVRTKEQIEWERVHCPKCGANWSVQFGCGLYCSRCTPERGHEIVSFLQYKDDEKELFYRNGFNVDLPPVRCRLRLPKDWSAEPEIVKRGDWDVQARMAGPAEHEWATVQHLWLAAGQEKADIDRWIVSLQLLHGHMFLEPHHSKSNGVQECKHLQFSKIKGPVTVYRSHHQADAISAYVGTLDIQGKIHRLFLINMRRGRDQWKMEYVFPAAPGVTAKNLAFLSEEIEKARRIFAARDIYFGENPGK